MKKLTALLLALVCLGAMLVSCSSGFDAKEWAEDNEKTKRSASYAELNDEKYYEIDVNEKINMDITVTTEFAGTFFAEIYNSKNKNAPVFELSIYKHEDGSLMSKVKIDGEEKFTPLNDLFHCNISISGSNDDFVIHVRGQQHAGSFKFDW